ncbi:MAG: HU family DNA-binding protein [Bacteroidia bacterium]|nr:integration host factor subunit beta [Bacteroidia bacterium]MDW8158102.1 HU family DNA-binding protein [Bacteroidia bacterium]
MTKAELVAKIAERTNMDKEEVALVVEEFCRIVKESVISGEPVFIRRFGSFVLKKRAAKKGRNIKQNLIVDIPAHFIPNFKPSKQFSEKVKNSSILQNLINDPNFDRRNIRDFLKDE